MNIGMTQQASSVLYEDEENDERDGREQTAGEEQARIGSGRVRGASMIGS
jgi:hypothetical protein